MKKTLTVNLGGTVFHIDEDAYQLLDKYLTNLRIHFKQEEGSDEIMNDFEMRISELFSERIKLGYEVITIEHVETIIQRMGKPEDLFGDMDKAQSESTQSTSEKHTVQKRLFRNPDDYMIGGVAGGISSYMGWDSTFVRIALFMLMFLYGVTIPIYFVLWLITPMARTATEKLQMRGKSVTVENIGKTVTDSFEKVSDNINSYVNSDKPRTAFQKIMDVFVSVIGAFLKVLLVLLAIFALPPIALALFIIIIVFICLLGGGVGILGHVLPNIHWNMLTVYPESALILTSFSSILIIIIPVFVVIYLLCGRIFKFKPMASGVKWTLLVLWLVALAVSIIFAVRYGFPAWEEWSGIGWDKTWHMMQTYF